MGGREKDQKVARKIGESYRMSHQEALDLARGGMKPTDIAAYLDIIVEYMPFKTIRGIAMKMGSHKIIQIDEDLNEIEKQLVCGHEIGHFLLHEDTNFMFIYEKTQYYPKQEYQANLFACQLILGEKAGLYETQVKEAASGNSLKKMVDKVAYLMCEEGERYGV